MGHSEDLNERSFLEENIIQVTDIFFGKQLYYFSIPACRFVDIL